MQPDHIVGPAEQAAYDAVDVGHAPARIVEDDAIRNGAHDVFSLAGLSSGVARVSINGQEKTRILNSQPDLLRKLFQQFDFLGWQAAHAAVIDFDGPQYGP